MAEQNFDDSGFDYHIEADEQSRESGALFYFGAVHYWVDNFRVVPDGPDGSGIELNATGDTEEDVQASLYSQLSAAQDEQDSERARADDANG